MAYFPTNVLDNQIKALPTIATASGSIANFTTDKAENLVSCVCEVASGSTELNVTACGKNLLPITLQNLKNNNPDGIWNDNAFTLNGITYTCNQDINGNITNISVSGTATNLSLFRLGGKFPTYLKDGNFYFNGIPSNSSNSSAFIQIQNFDTLSGVANITTNDTLLTINSSRYSQGIVIRVNSGNTINTPVIFTPMFRLASESDNTFATYKGQTYNITFGETLSGNGSFDVLSGILTRSDDTTKQLNANYIQANNGINNIYCDTGDISVQFVLSVGEYVNQNV